MADYPIPHLAEYQQEAALALSELGKINLERMDTIIVDEAFSKVYDGGGGKSFDTRQPPFEMVKSVYRQPLYPEVDGVQWFYKSTRVFEFLGYSEDDGLFWRIYARNRESDYWLRGLVILSNRNGDFKLRPTIEAVEEVDSIRENLEMSLAAHYDLFSFILSLGTHGLVRRPVRGKVIPIQRGKKVRKANHRYFTYGEYRINPMVENNISTPIEREFTTESWSVRGHYRQLKSGKVIYIKPQQRHRSSKLLSDRATFKNSIYHFSKQGDDNEGGLIFEPTI